MPDKPGTGAVLDTGHALATNLALAYLFNEGTGTTVHDYSGNGHTGTIDNTGSHFTWVTSLFFTGASAYALSQNANTTTQTVTVAGFSSVSAPFTIALWFSNAGSDTFGTLFAQSSSSGLWTHNSGAGYKLDYEQGGTHDSTTVQSHGANLRVVVTASSTQVKFYVNTTLDATVSVTSPAFTPNETMNDTTSETFIGTMDLLYFWAGRELTSTEIATLDGDPFGMWTTGGSPWLYYAQQRQGGSR